MTDDELRVEGVRAVIAGIRCLPAVEQAELVRAFDAAMTRLAEEGLAIVRRGRDAERAQRN